MSITKIRPFYNLPDLLSLSRDSNTDITLSTIIPSPFGDIRLAVDKQARRGGKHLEVRLEFPEVFAFQPEPILLPCSTQESTLVSFYAQQLALSKKAIERKMNQLRAPGAGTADKPRAETQEYKDILALVLSTDTLLTLCTTYSSPAGESFLVYERGKNTDSMIWQYPESFPKSLAERHLGSYEIKGLTNEAEIVLAYDSHRNQMIDNLYEVQGDAAQKNGKTDKNPSKSSPTIIPFLRIVK